MFTFMWWFADSKCMSIIMPMDQESSIHLMHLNCLMKHKYNHIKYFYIGENVKFSKIIVDTFLKFW